MKVLLFNLERRDLNYYFREMYQAFEPEIKAVYSGSCDGVLSQKNDGMMLKLSLAWEGRQSLEKTYQMTGDPGPLEKSIYKGFLYDFLCVYFNRTLQWGTLTGIKPVKIVQNQIDLGFSFEEIKEKLMVLYRVSEDRAQLLIEIAKKQSIILSQRESDEKKEWVSIYVGIPLCPQKCSYCSFTSTVVDKNKENLKNYFKNLLIEIKCLGETLSHFGVKVDTLYIGGGTPTVLSAYQLNKLMTALEESFTLKEIREYTLEAGRPETITKEKLEIAKKHGVDRICLNPQSMNPKTLAAIGRYWKEGLIEEKEKLIRSEGFKTLNMDLIVGLPNEKSEDFMKTLDQIIAMNPENITIHHLSIKKGSSLKHHNGIHVNHGFGEGFYQRLQKKLQNHGYAPYYLYRLKYTLGNSENIGYAKKGHEGLYNVLMMAEKQSVIGVGAGSTGKLYHCKKDEIERIYTMKDVRSYNERIEEVIESKKQNYKSYFEE
ncbi:MAG: coproporphyrinogen dehydrogenase HemZ [Eubacteriaceae bacterium]